MWEATAGKSALVIVILGLFMLYTSSCGRHLYLCGTRYPFVKNTLTGQFRDELESRDPLLKLSGIVDAPAPRHTQLGERGIQLRESQGQRAKYVKRQLAAGKMVGESLEQFLHLLVRQVLESPSATIIAGLSLRTWSRKTLLANESASRIGPVTGRAQGIAPTMLDFASRGVHSGKGTFLSLHTEAGGSAFVFGHSSGAVLAIEAARLLPIKITKLAVYEPPFIIDDSRHPLPKDYVTQLTKLVSSGRRGEAIAYYMTKALGVPVEEVAPMRNAPMSEEMEALAHTLVYDGTLAADTMSGKWASVLVPTLMMDGGESFVWMHHGVQALVEILPHAQHRRFPGQDHGVADDVLVPVLVEFFKG